MEAKKPVEKKGAKILVVDDHPVVRQGLEQLINHEKDLTVVAGAESGKDAMDAAAKLKPDIAIVDIGLKDTNGIELIKDLKIRFPDLPILVLSMHDEMLYAERALSAGAGGYVMKEEATGKVVEAVRKILKGDVYLSPRMTSKLISRAIAGDAVSTTSPFELLSDRELEVFELIGQGHKTTQIAEKLHLSPKTVETYREHIKRKLNLASSTELHQHAFQWVQTGKGN